jgi:hypothetical protein
VKKAGRSKSPEKPLPPQLDPKHEIKRAIPIADEMMKRPGI